MARKHKVRLDAAVYERAQGLATVRGYASVEDLLEHLLERELRRDLAGGPPGGPSDQEELDRRLKGLGYL